MTSHDNPRPVKRLGRLLPKKLRGALRKLVAPTSGARDVETAIDDSASTLIYIHIGKCGGSSLWRAIKRSDRLRADFGQIHKIHVHKPPVLANARYLIVLRNPVSRAISAFNWRHKLVVEDATQAARFPSEHAVLTRYSSLNALAEALYAPDGRPNRGAGEDFMAIHHLRENIAFYLEDLLPALTPEQVFRVMNTEHLDEDIPTVLGAGEAEKVHANRPATAAARIALSDLGRKNLRRFLEPDYDCIARLLEMHPIPAERRAALLA